MKTFTLTQVGILTLALSFSAVALAERGSTDRQQNMQRYTQILDLTEEQREALQALKDESNLSRDARQAAMRQHGGSPLTAEQRNQVRESRQAQMQEKLSAILTEEQQAQLQEHREQRLSQREGKRENMGQHAKRNGGCDMKGSNRAERQEMRQERRQARES
jgi:Spy/CpxP family protein refolding chaperone